MNNNIDVLFIGHNEGEFALYEKLIRQMGENKGAYRDLNMSFLTYNNKPHTIADLYNKFYPPDKKVGYLNFAEVFSLTIAYLGTYVNRRGFSFDFINSFKSDKKLLIEKLMKNNISAIAITTTLYVSSYPIIEIVSLIKQYNKNCKIIIGGPFISSQVKSCENKEQLYNVLESIDADVYINNSQGEETLCKVLDSIKNNKKTFDDINNIIYRKGDYFVSNSIRNENNRLEKNIVDWNLFTDKVKKFAMMRTSISCPFECSFCGYPQHAGRYQVSNLQSVEKELNLIANLGSVSSLQFIDDTFNIPNERFKDILKIMIKNKYKFKWNSYYRCQFADRETVELMKESGCEGVVLGIESGSQKILNNMNKKATVEQYKFGIKLLREYGITTFASFIIGFPGETHQTVSETMDFIEETKPTFYRTQLWYCDSITPIWEERHKYGLENNQYNWSHDTMNSIEACNEIERVFINIKNSTWLPQYNFNMKGVFSLLHRGIDMDEVLKFIDTFNKGIKEKLNVVGQCEVKQSLINDLKLISNHSMKEHSKRLNKKYGAEFEI